MRVSWVCCRCTCRGHVRLVEEDSAEVVLVGEYFRLLREKRSAAVDHVDARQPVLQGNFLNAGWKGTAVEGITR